MGFEVACLRPESDFLDIGVEPPKSLSIAYLSPTDAELPSVLSEVRAVVMPAVGPKLERSLFENSAIELVQVTGAGVDRVDEAAMKELGIAVANVAGGSNDAVAEYAVGSALTLLRRTAWADAEIREGNYSEIRSRMIADSLSGLTGLTVGVVGLGTIGRVVASAFKRMGGRIVFFDPAVEDADVPEELEAERLTLADLLSNADVVTLHIPLIPATTGLIGASELATMKPDSILINAARGGIVDEAALATALSSGDLGGAAVDVYSEEPPSSSNPLFALEGDAARRTIFTPHIAGVTRQAWANLFVVSWDNVVRVLQNGEAPLNRVY
ncbi:MAG: NAD(P)-dependent oxidoreductase [Candidatus Rariloculaceae bacterium]